MIPLGYMAKFVARRPDLLKNQDVEFIYSVCACISGDVSACWRQNGYGFFDSPSLILDEAAEKKMPLESVTWFYYEGFEMEFEHETGWHDCSEAKPSGVVTSTNAVLRGYDIVVFDAHGDVEHSPLSCNYMAEEVTVNKYCLLDSFDVAKSLIEQGVFKECEPGRYRIIAVHTVEPIPHLPSGALEVSDAQLALHETFSRAEQ